MSTSWRSRSVSSESIETVAGRHSFMAYVQQHSNHFSGGTLDAAATSPTRLASALLNAILATAFFRCWHILIFYFGWATMVTLINKFVTSLSIASTLLTVVGTVLGFVVSYRTTSSFERYNEGRRYWSQIILASRTLARAVWFHVPSLHPLTAADEREGRTEEERRARDIIEKKTVINLIEAFSVAVKHYLRGEEGIAYVDLYHLVKFLPSYAFPAGVIPTEFEAAANLARTQSYRDATEKAAAETNGVETAVVESGDAMRPSISVAPALPTNGYDPAAQNDGEPQQHVRLGLPLPATTKSRRPGIHSVGASQRRPPTFVSSSDRHVVLLPASMPPTNSVFDIFPFSLFIKLLENKGKEVKGKKAAKMRAKTVVVTRNVPLEISMYLTSYVATLGARKSIDVPTNNLLIGSVNQLTDALTGLERILTTPIPFSYSMHLWIVTILYNLALPFQIYSSLGWVTIPASGIVSFVFFGFLVAGEEIENPFGYDKNDLNMDHFTHNIIRNELRALTAFPPPEPEIWAFSPRNDRLFAASDPSAKDEKNISMGRENQRADAGTGLTPEEWIRRGTTAMRDALARAH